MDVTSKTVDEIDWSKEKENMKLVEAVLFVSGKFLSMAELMNLSDLNSLMIQEVLTKLKEKHNKDDSALEIVERDNLWKMDVRQEYHGIINKLAGGTSEFTKAEQETLAIIAYKQPIKQSVIVKIRGNKAYDHVHKFRQLGLIRARKEGHTNILELTESFYEYFNVSENNTNPLKEELIDEGYGDD